jgi:hypothetical protein
MNFQEFEQQFSKKLFVIICDRLESGQELPKDMFSLACNIVLNFLSQFPA